MTKPFSLLALISAGVLFAGCTTQSPQPATSNPENAPVTQETSPADSQIVTYTLAEVATHAIPDDCWMVIDNQVYDLSEFSTHPGGEALYQGCGQDATNLFNTRPTGSQTPHSDNARSLLPAYAIGTLSQE